MPGAMKALPKLEIAAAVASFALIFVSGVFRLLLIRAGVDEKAAKSAMAAWAIFFFLIFGFSCIGLMIHVFIVLQVRIGNGAAPMIRFLSDHETGVTFAFWGFLGMGALLAVPFALRDMGFSFEWPLRSAGVLVADIGMTIDEVRQRSTLKMEEPRLMGDGSRLTVKSPVFDYQIGNSNVRFPQSRYYWLETGKRGDARILVANIGISPRKMPKPDLEAFQRRAQDQLLADGWMPGHYLAKSEETVRLWAGKKTAGDGRYWTRGGTLLIFEVSRMDEEKRDEPPGSGEFILNIALRTKDSDRDLVFERSAWPN
jgi:hypothetical protein